MSRFLYVETLGCPKNRVDAEIFLGSFLHHGWEVTWNPEKADLIILNSCGFIEAAREETIDRFFALYDMKKKEAKLVLAGCLPQLYPEIRKELTEADMVVGIDWTGQMPEFIEKYWEHGGENVPVESKFIYSSEMERVLTISPYYAYVKIADGCDNFCSYCSIPHIRGRFRERSSGDIAKEVKNLLKSGVKEFVFIAQDTTNYGKTHGTSLEKLLKKLDKIDLKFWLRIMYLYPSKINMELLRVIKDSGHILPYFEVPVQHVSDRVLHDMNRPYGKKDVENLIHSIRDNFGSDAVIRTSLITGFPTEKKADFDEMMQFVAKDYFDYTGIFSYSRELITPAAKLRQIPHQRRSERKQQLEAAAMQSMERSLERFVGTTQTVLFEDFDRDTYLSTARGYFQAPEIDGVVILTNIEQEKPGEFLSVKITQRDGIDFIAEIIR